MAAGKLQAHSVLFNALLIFAWLIALRGVALDNSWYALRGGLPPSSRVIHGGLPYVHNTHVIVVPIQQ